MCALLSAKWLNGGPAPAALTASGLAMKGPVQSAAPARPGTPVRPPVPMRNLNWLLLFSMCLVEGMDMNILPSAFRAMESELGFSPVILAGFQTIQGVAQALSGIVWANLIDGGLSCKKVVCAGVLGWAAANSLLAYVESAALMCLFRASNGLCLGMVLPVVQSLIAKHVKPEVAGSFFGLQSAFLQLGRIIGILAMASVSEKVIYGVPGWRVGLAATAVLSYGIVLAFLVFFEDPPSKGAPSVDLQKELRKFSSYLRKPAFCVILCQGMVGTIPNAAMSFQLMFMQYCGLSNADAAIAASMVVVGIALGAPLGGYIGDAMERWSEQHGRPLTGQISVIMGIPLMYYMFMVAPHTSNMFWHFASASFLLGLLAHWCAPGCNMPLLARLVPADSKASVMAWEYSFESMSGQTLGPMIVSVVATQMLHFRVQEAPLAEMPDAQRLLNAEALGQGLLLSTMLPWFICATMFTLLHFCDLPGPEGEALVK
ncbi:unnamed protein product [Effrenium voratum]|nr:unnamed protein product [Effrenium voratum]